MAAMKLKRKLKRMILLCGCTLAIFSVSAFAAHASERQKEDLENIENIDFPPWLREGETDHPETFSQDSEDKKVVSILSDSLGTYEGYTTWSIYYYYYCSQYMDVSETWWMRYIENNQMRLGVNESLGGSKVAWWEGEPSGYNSKQCMAAEERIARLDDNGTPDIILFFGGTNDIASTPVGEFVPGEGIGNVSEFCSAYQTALARLKEYYPQAEIICLTPYYRDISSWSSSTNEDVDLYADCIVEICQYYGIRCVDLRQSGLDEKEDMCGPDYLHINEKGAYKIWHMLQYDQPVLKSEGIRVLQNDSGTVRAEYLVSGLTEGMEYQWQVYDCSAAAWIYASEWSESNQFEYRPKKSGGYWLYCTARNALGEEASDVAGVTAAVRPVTIEGLSWIYQEDEIQIGAAVSSPDEETEIRWQSYNLDTLSWNLISDWSSSNWSSWQPKKGNYWLHVEVRDSYGKIVSKTINFAVDRNYPVYINGKYQGPDPSGGGWLIGVSTNINPGQKYRYELLILDCGKYVSGDPHPWIYGTGLQTLDVGSAFWTTWQPPHQGYYWTYFRIYDESGSLIEDQCYGAVFS